MLKIITMGYIALVVTGTLNTLAWATTDELSMDDFDFGVELLSVDDPVRRFNVTPIIMQGVKRSDLGDVRVFDYYNNLMPMKLISLDSDIEMFQQSLVVTKYKNAGQQGFILERPQDDQRWLKSLHLNWQQGRAPNVLVIRVEHSADLINWNPLKPSEVISNYRFKNTLINHNTIDINDHTERYLRLVYKKRQLMTPVLQSANSIVLNKKPIDSKWITAGKLETTPDTAGTFVFNSASVVTPRLVNFYFNKLNMVLTGSLYRMTAVNGASTWKLVNDDFNAYKVTLNNKIVASSPINVADSNATQWKIVSEGNTAFSEEEMPDVMVDYPVYDVVFADKGREPYTLVWGSSKTGAPESDSSLPDDAVTVYHGQHMDNAQLVELAASRRFIMVISIAGLVILALVAISGFLYYRRSSMR